MRNKQSVQDNKQYANIRVKFAYFLILRDFRLFSRSNKSLLFSCFVLETDHFSPTSIGVKFSFIFTLLIYLSIGPGLGIPRAGSVPFEMAVFPYLPEGTNFKLWMAIYTLIFFAIVF